MCEELIMSNYPIELAARPKNSTTGQGGKRKHYRKPLLEALGDLRTLTLGGTRGAGDSGCELLENEYAGVYYPCPPG
jgi:hypothetical protein